MGSLVNKRIRPIFRQVKISILKNIIPLCNYGDFLTISIAVYSSELFSVGVMSNTSELLDYCAKSGRAESLSATRVTIIFLLVR